MSSTKVEKAIHSAKQYIARTNEMDNESKR